jgi:hypothetical protein
MKDLEVVQDARRIIESRRNEAAGVDHAAWNFLDNASKHIRKRELEEFNRYFREPVEPVDISKPI